MIIVRAPFRISLAGGGTDLRDFYKNYEFGAVCSFTINRYIYVTINDLADYFPHRIRVAYSKTELTQNVNEIQHPIVREALKDMQIKGGIDINIMADIPAGTGLGSSSTFTVALLHALSLFKNKIPQKEFLAAKACELAMDRLNEPCGKQDQYASAYGGFNYFKFFSDERVESNPIPISKDIKKQLKDRFYLFYLGGNRLSDTLLKTQAQNVSKNENALKKMRDQASDLTQILTGNRPLDELGEILHEGWILKKSLADGMTNLEIDKVYEKAIKAGALGGKLLGAGGTGFLLFYVRPEQGYKVMEALSSYKKIDFDFDLNGSHLLYYGG
jgi:D-glycero-alpha-D-manno-heptose-7-phosphate kinase